MSRSTKTALIILGFLSALLIVAQLVMGVLILNGASAAIRKSHQHSGYLTVAVSLVYILGSLSVIASAPGRASGSRQ